MREILFRGRYEVIDYKTRAVRFDWAEGCLDTTHCGVVIFSNPMARFAVDPKTVGQYTGLKDVNGKRIFEGDIIADETTIFEVKWQYAQWYFVRAAGFYQSPSAYSNADRMGIIGNIHDNPELLEGGDE
jgi:uncharacterized phage protein (TIGR01671 family)